MSAAIRRQHPGSRSAMEILATEHPAILGRIFAAMDVWERKRVPCVNRAWLKIHLEYPPLCSTMKFFDRIREAQVIWFEKQCRVLEALDMMVSSEEDACKVSRMLGMAARLAPRLRQLRLFTFWYAEDISTAVIADVQHLTQLTKLEIYGATLSTNMCRSALQGFSALQSLQEMNLHLRLHDADTVQAQIFWQALAKLPGLTKCEFDIDRIGSMSTAAILQPVSLLTQLRSLTLEAYPYKKPSDRILPLELTVLTQLTELNLKSVPVSSVRPVLSLPSLHRIELTYLQISRQPWNLLWESPHLTRLAISSLDHLSREPEWKLPVKNILSPALPLSTLQRLRSLSLVGLQLESFPAWFAERMPNLTALELSFGGMTRIPESGAHLTALQRLDLTRNQDLRLHYEDVDLLSSLANLRELKVWENRSPRDVNRSGEEMQVAWALSRRMPDLQCRFHSGTDSLHGF